MLLPLLQDPELVAEPGFVEHLQSVGWVDRTALAVLFVFFTIGLWKGVIWQTSRVAILLVAYVLSGAFGADLAGWIARTPALGGTEVKPPMQPPETPETTLYVAYVLVFVGVLVALSLLAMLLQKLAKQAGLGFFDRLGGGFVGIATGAGVVLFGLFVVHMFFRDSQLSVAAEKSHALRLSRDAVDWLGDTVPDELRQVIALSPLRTAEPPSTPHAPGEGLQHDPRTNRLPASGTTPPPAPAKPAPAPPSPQPQRPR